MQSRIIFCFLIATAIIAISCEKVIDVDLKDAGKKYVIEGRINNLPGPYYVKISKTGNFYDSTAFPMVSNAEVIIADLTGGQTDTLREVSDGVYRTTIIKGVVGHTYTLKVVADGNVFTSASTMPAMVVLDSIYISEVAIFDENMKCLVAAFTDPPGIKNYYRYQLYKNDRLNKNIYTQDDEFMDGRINSRPLMVANPDSAYKTGDKARLEMLCLDSAVYKYWYSAEMSSTGDSMAPANPVSNIVGGALGYFSAETSQTKEIIVK